jgi:hypothetical protein
MPHVRQFEDLIAWKKARALTADIYRVTRQGDLAHDYGLLGALSQAQFDALMTQANEIGRIIAGLHGSIPDHSR